MNNDLEGWHNRLNNVFTDRMNFYLLVKSIFSESEAVDRGIRLVRREKMTRRERKQYKSLNACILSIWRKNRSGRMNDRQVVDRVAELYGPGT